MLKVNKRMHPAMRRRAPQTSVAEEIRFSYETYCNAWGPEKPVLSRAWDDYFHTVWSRLSHAVGVEEANRIITEAKAEAVCRPHQAKVFTFVA